MGKSNRVNVFGAEGGRSWTGYDKKPWIYRIIKPEIFLLSSPYPGKWALGKFCNAACYKPHFHHKRLCWTSVNLLVYDLFSCGLLEDIGNWNISMTTVFNKGKEMLDFFLWPNYSEINNWSKKVIWEAFFCLFFFLSSNNVPMIR